MKKLLLAALLLACAPVHAQLLTKFGPVNGILVGTVANPQTAAATSANILALWSGSCSGTTFLNGAGACATPAGVAPSGTQNLVYATPNGSTGSATLRALVGADLPPINLASTANGGVLSTSILLGTNGGTSNGFFSVTGPTTALRTFTFPNASATVLTTNALVTVAQGGTGVGTLTGLIKGNGTSAFTAATSADVIALWTGTCSSTTFLRGDGACTTAGAGGSPGGSSTNVQFNNAGVFGGDSGFTYAGAGGALGHTGTTNGAISFSQTNSSNGANAATQVTGLNDVGNTVYIGIAGSGVTGVEWTGGPTGQQAFVGNSGNIPLAFGNNNIAKLVFNGYSAPVGRQFDIVGTTATSAALGYVGIIDQAGVRYGYFGKSSTGTVISYESDADVQLVSGNGAHNLAITAAGAATKDGFPIAQSLAWTAAYVGNSGVSLTSIVAVSWPIACADIPGSAVGASTATTYSVGTLPAGAQPAHPQSVAFPPTFEDNGVIGGFTASAVVNTNGTITFLKNNSSTGWTASGQKGVTTDTTMCYFLN